MLATISYTLLTIIIFYIMTWLYKRSGISFLFPILTATIVLLVLLSLFDISYDNYMQGGRIINFF